MSTWKKTNSGGYSHSSGHELVNIRGVWMLSSKDGMKLERVSPATFAQADRMIAKEDA